MQILLTLSHSQAAVERGFSVNKEVLAPNMQEMNLKAIRLVHSSVASLNIKTSYFTVTDKRLKSCSHASNKYKMYLMEKKAVEEKTDMGQKRKALQGELMAAKKKKTELESVASQLLDTANKKAKEAEKKSGVAAMKALIMESNASRERAEEVKGEDIPAKAREVKDIEEKLKKFGLTPTDTQASKKETRELFMCGMINLGKYYELTKKGSLF